MKFLKGKDENKVLDIPVICIRPNKTQPRKNFDEDELLSLSQSIMSNGILQPLTVRKISDTEYELIAGERRLRASVMAGLKTVPCVLMKCTDKESAHTETISEELTSDECDTDLTELIRERFDFVYPTPASSKLPAKLSVSKLTPTILDDDEAELEGEYEPYSFEAKRPLFLDEDEAPTVSGAERGTATHLFMQFCDFSRFATQTNNLAELIEDEAARLAENKYITKRAASLINVRALAIFFAGETFADISSAQKVWREHRFNVNLPASDFTSDPELAVKLHGENILVQGVIDCFYENPDGTLTVIDYKTDFIPSELSRSEAEKLLLERHRLQLSYYRAACEKISAKRVSRVAIYSFALGCTIDVI